MKERVAWIDNARFIAILLMISGHVSGYLLHGDVAGISMFQTVIVVFNMPLFVILSGYGNYGSLMRISDTSTFCANAMKALRHVLCPMIFPMLLYCMIENSLDPIGFENGFWFLWMLFYLLLISSTAFGIVRIIATLSKRFLCFENPSFFLFLSILLMMCIAVLFDRQYTCEMCSYFAVGILAHHYSFFDSKLKSWSIIILIAFLSIGAYVYWFDFQSNHWFYWNGLRQMMIDGHLSHYVLRQLIAIGISFTIILITVRLSDHRTFISTLGMHTLTMYLVQDIFIRYSELFGFNAWGKCLGWLQVFGFSLGLVLLSVGIVYIVHKTKTYISNIVNHACL